MVPLHAGRNASDGRGAANLGGECFSWLPFFIIAWNGTGLDRFCFLSGLCPFAAP
jgi:hypothetical protein